MTEEKIHDTVEGPRHGIVRTPPNALFTDMVELVWQTQDLSEMTMIFPRKTAEEFLSKHLLPQKEQGILVAAEIRELPNLGTE